MSTEATCDPPDLDFAQFEAVRAAGKAVLLDVRNPGELETEGTIPGGVNVPTPVFAAAFSAVTNLDDFRESFGIDRPAKSDHIVVYCKIGKRSMQAAKFLVSNGYTKVENYSGLDDWKANMQ